MLSFFAGFTYCDGFPFGGEDGAGIVILIGILIFVTVVYSVRFNFSSVLLTEPINRVKKRLLLLIVGLLASFITFGVSITLPYFLPVRIKGLRMQLKRITLISASATLVLALSAHAIYIRSRFLQRCSSERSDDYYLPSQMELLQSLVIVIVGAIVVGVAIKYLCSFFVALVKILRRSKT